MIKFEVLFLEPAKIFLDDLDEKSRGKVLFNIRKSREVSDPELFKKLTQEIWEFRTLYNNRKIRLLAFWDTIEGKQTIEIATHGFIKKTQKTPSKEIERALQLRKEYLDNK